MVDSRNRETIVVEPFSAASVGDDTVVVDAGAVIAAAFAYAAGTAYALALVGVVVGDAVEET